MKKIRKTNDLIYFNLSGQNENTFQISQDRRSLKNDDNSSILAISSPSNSFNTKYKNSHKEDINSNRNKFMKSIPNEDVGIEKRKILRAKRLLTGHAFPINNNFLDKESISLDKKLDKISGKRSSVGIYKSFYLNLPEINISKKSFSFEESKVLIGNNSTVNILPSPISPSTESTNNHQTSILSQHLHFNASFENLQPSTSGAVEPSNKRRTYELEESVIDVSLLKIEAEKDASRISSIPSNFSNDSNENKNVSNTTYSKVTIRKRWDKENIFSPFASPKVINRNDGNKEEKKSSTKKFVSKVRMPNFSSIHQKALEKIENITEYKERKENRARMLLSGQKPKNENNKSKAKESKKQLRFASNTIERKKSLTFIPLPSTPRPKYKFVENDNTSATKIPFKNILQQIPQQTKIPIAKNDLKTFNVGTTTANPFDQKQVNNVKAKASIMSKKTEFKKCITTKGRLEKNPVNSRRCAIKGVRSNRRFELLMNMRNGL